jgi:predicted nucleotidyltransferase
MKDIQNLLRPFVSKFERIDQIILFGSRAKGDCGEDSDIDLAIDAEYRYDSMGANAVVSRRIAEVSSRFNLDATCI